MIKFLCAVLSNLLLCCFAFAGVANVGNGGDVIYCPGNLSEVYYSLDFVLARAQLENSTKIIQVDSLNQSTERISRLLESKVPSLKNSFDHFVSEFRNQDSSRTYLWKPSRLELPDIQDENFKRFPRGVCAQIQAQPWGAEQFQAVIRTKTIENGVTKTNFEYDRFILAEVERTNPTQLSFVLVHEWLWNYNSNVRSNRIINYLLHSEQFEKQTSAQVTQELTNLGLVNITAP